MARWIEFDEYAKKELAKLDRLKTKRLIDFLKDRILNPIDPHSFGQALKGYTLNELWKSPLSDFRTNANIQDERMTVLMLRVGNRSHIYR